VCNTWTPVLAEQQSDITLSLLPFSFYLCFSSVSSSFYFLGTHNCSSFLPSLVLILYSSPHVQTMAVRNLCWDLANNSNAISRSKRNRTLHALRPLIVCKDSSTLEQRDKTHASPATRTLFGMTGTLHALWHLFVCKDSSKLEQRDKACIIIDQNTLLFHRNQHTLRPMSSASKDDRFLLSHFPPLTYLLHPNQQQNHNTWMFHRNQHTLRPLSSACKDDRFLLSHVRLWHIYCTRTNS